MGKREHDAVDAPGYEILERVGGSDGADVYRARQQALGRQVAIKVLRGESTGDEQLARFEFETRTAAALLHPHIVPLLDSGTTRDGRRYYAMPWLDGGDLAARIPVAPAELRPLGAALCDALWYAHGRNVVHRDIKPSNVLFDDEGRALLADFGIATSIIGARGLTVPGRALGSARYISPEQARGEKVDPRADLYSLGVVLHEALTGTVPYDARDEVSLAALHADAPVPKLPERFAGWQGFFDRALAKDPAARFMSARTMAQALEMIEVDAAARPAPAVAPVVIPAVAAPVAAVAELDELPRIRVEPPAYRDPLQARPPERYTRWAGALVLLGLLAIGGVVAYALTRSPEEKFQPLAVDPDAPTAPLPIETPQPAAAPAANPGRVAAAAVNTPPGAPIPGTEGVAIAAKPRAANPPPRPGSAPQAADPGAIEREVPGDAARARDEDEYAIPDEAPAIAAGDDALARDRDDDPGYDGSPTDDDSRDAFDDAPPAPEPPDYSDDPAVARGNWAPPIGPLLLGGSADEQVEAIDAQIDAGRDWLEDERWRVDALQETLPPAEAERELDAFAADEQAFERWLDRMDALRARIERDRY